MDSEKKVISKTIGGQVYTLTIPTFTPWTAKNLVKTALRVIVLPVALPFGLIYAAAMVTPLLRNKVLGLFLPIGMNALDKIFQTEREALLRHVSGKVLDVGSGGGAYLRYTHNADDVVAVEPVEELHPKIRESGKYLHKLSIVKDLADLNPA
jgi:hypothetical protein